MTKKQQIEQAYQFMLQAYATTVFLVELDRCKFLNSDFYEEKLLFKDDFIKNEVLPKIGIGNLGAFAMFLYALLVLPYEIRGKIDKFLGENPENWQSSKKILDNAYVKINTDLKSSSYESSYNYDKNGGEVNFVYHIRNATSHGHLSHDQSKKIFRFKDTKRSEEFWTEISAEDFKEKFFNPLLIANREFLISLKKLIDTLSGE